MAEGLVDVARSRALLLVGEGQGLPLRGVDEVVAPRVGVGLLPGGIGADLVGPRRGPGQGLGAHQRADLGEGLWGHVAFGHEPDHPVAGGPPREGGGDGKQKAEHEYLRRAP